jgi:tRNA(Arg) A34 adenosine deaminase TadA
MMTTRCQLHHPTRRHRFAAAGTAVLAAALAPRNGQAAVAGEPATEADEVFMRQAIEIARNAGKEFAAVIVKDGKDIATGYNPRKVDGVIHDPTAHGEMVAIQEGIRNHGAPALHGATLYTTGGSCPMCMTAIVWCGMGRVVYGVPLEKLAGIMDQIMVPSVEIAKQAPFLKIGVTGGVLADEAWTLFQ